jgi:hypothetical protein
MPPPKLPAGWFFHVDSRSVMATSWEPIVEHDRPSANPAEQPVRGFRVRLLETAGKSGRVHLSTFRPVSSATEVDFRGKILTDCPVVDGRIELDMAAFQWSQVEALWQTPPQGA